VQRDRLKVDSLKWIASRLFPKRYGDKMELLGQDAGSSSTISISWLESDKSPPVAPAPPKQITYQKPELPGDLSEGDCQKLLQILEVAKRVAPSDSVPGDVLEVIRKALLAHFREEPPAPLAKRIVLPRRGKSGKIAPGITRATGSSRSMALDTLRRQHEGDPPGKALARKAIAAHIRSLCRAYTE
jgi:hypothetical protein